MRHPALYLPGLFSALTVLCFAATVGHAQQFGTVTTFPNPGGVNRWTEGVEAADVDHDGDIDVFFAEGDGFSSASTKRQNVLVINKLIETAAWTFADESVLRLGAHISNARTVCTGDVTGDGWVDAMFANAFNTDPPFLYINGGAGSPGNFTFEGVARGFTTNYSSACAQFGDLDDDGDLDVIINDAYFTSGVPHLFFNNGTGFFTENAGALGAPAKNSQMDVQLVDIDNDFDLDFFGDCRATNTNGNHYMMLNNGAGTFSDVSSLLAAGTGNTYEAEVGDLDGDSDLDLFFVSLSGFAEGSVRNNVVPSASLSFTNQATIGGNDDNEIALFDYDNDGDYDVLVGSLAGHEYVYRNNGAFSFTDTSAATIQSVSDSSLDCTVADLNNDGKYDIITAQGESGTFGNKYYRNNTGTADTLKPVIVGHINPATASPTGPVIVHAKIRDQVLDDGINFVKGSANYVINTAPATSAVSITGGGFSPAVATVPAGTTVTWTNNSAGSQSVKSTSAPYTYDSGSFGVSATYSYTFVTPGTYNYTSVPSGLNGQVVVTGSATTVAATYSGGQIYRFKLTDTAGGAGIQLCYELRFTDWAGNVTVTDSRCVTLGTPPPVGTSFCSPGNDLTGIDCPCFITDLQTADPGHGCGNSVFAGGALLTAVGTTSPDTVQFTASDIPAGSGSVYLQGSDDLTMTTGPVQFGDGIRCAGGTLIRLGLKNDTDNDSVTTLGPSSGDAQVSVLGSVIPGNTYVYQVYYRNPNPAWCAPNTFNVTQAIRITW